MRRAADSSTSSSERWGAGVQRGRGWGWAAIGCLLVIAVALWWMSANKPALAWVALRTSAPIVRRAFEERTEAWVARARHDERRAGVVFGDSVFARANSPVVPALDAALNVRGMPADLLDLSYLGLSAIHFYYACPPVLRGRPDFAVIEVNLRTFGDDWRDQVELQAPQLSKNLSLRQVLRVRDALADQSVGVLAPWTYRLEDAAGWLFVFDGLRRSGRDWLERIGRRINAGLGLRERSRGQQFMLMLQLNARTARTWYGKDFVAHPSTEVFGALAEQLRAAGIRVLFVVAPVNLSKLAELGVSIDDLNARIERLRDAIGVPAGDWLETSSIVGPTDFVDAIHVTPDATDRLAQLIADRLVQPGDSSCRTVESCAAAPPGGR